MLIAFEGPDQTGKSTSAKNLSHNGQPIYNATKDNHLEAGLSLTHEEDLVQTFDRIDWFSHMVYRLALPEKEWNDARPRTVFAMPDTHLVVKMHRPDLANFLAPDEIVETPIARVNPFYFYFADFFTSLNEEKDFSLFKTISIIEVANEMEDGLGTFSQRLVGFSSPVLSLGDVYQPDYNDSHLLDVLREEERQR